MLTLCAEKRLLQVVVALASLVPLLAGLYGMLGGARMLGGGTSNMDSHFRYLSGLLFVRGVASIA